MVIINVYTFIGIQYIASSLCVYNGIYQFSVAVVVGYSISYTVFLWVLEQRSFQVIGFCIAQNFLNQHLHIPFARIS